MKYTKEVLVKVIAENNSMAGVIRSLGSKQSGGLHYHLMLRAKEWNIDMSHFVGKAGISNKKKTRCETLSLDSVCVENSKYNRTDLKRRLIKIGKLKNECCLCGQQTEWRGKTLVMVMDHINGVRDDNKIENLRLLCPHCNSQQFTFCRAKSSFIKRICGGGCGRTISKKNKSDLCSRCLFKEGLKKLECPMCHGVKSRRMVLCDNCSKEGRVPELAAGESFRNSCESLVGSTPFPTTILMSVWWNGRHARLRILWRNP